MYYELSLCLGLGGVNKGNKQLIANEIHLANFGFY